MGVNGEIDRTGPGAQAGEDEREEARPRPVAVARTNGAAVAAAVES